MLYFSKTNNMNNFRNLIEEANEIETTDLLAVPGAATIKACAIVVNSFLQHPVFPERIRGSKSNMDESVNDITSLNNSISVFESIQADKKASTSGSKVLPEIPIVSKAQGMVHHLKHTHSKSGHS